MTDQERANRLVEAGILRRYELRSANAGAPQLYVLHSNADGPLLNAEQVCQNGRVVLAVMEKCRERGWLVNMAHDGAIFVFTDLDEPKDCCESYEKELAIAIIDAYLDAMEGQG